MSFDMWAYHPESHHTPGMVLIGYTVVATDGDVGIVHEDIEELGSTYVVVDTDPWVFNGPVLLPAGTIMRVDRHAKTILVNRTRDEIRHAPAYEPKRHRGDSQYRDNVADYYRPFYT
ncbi:PRC-barrel domain-containing protein [Streptomyces sp. NPDC019396]|uniref:PRC-barrel domain-containing protein n=1 Tax=Streptomyces sp. NPDC019396 TaxID=3154687 RepID=UPI003402F683